jgi:hypothetical protein
MTKLTIFTLYLLSAFPLLADASVGFQTGDSFQTVRIEGLATVTCEEGGWRSSASYRCVSQTLLPGEFARLRGPEGVDADEVTLLALRQDGSSREKTERYDSSTGLSRHFNLWVSTLLQRPLLRAGDNEVRYVFRRQGESVLEGSFVASVSRGPDRRCRFRRHYFSGDLNDCRSGQRVCETYFRDENYCR